MSIEKKTYSRGFVTFDRGGIDPKNWLSQSSKYFVLNHFDRDAGGNSDFCPDLIVIVLDPTVSIPLIDHSQMIPHLPKAWITVRHPHERITREVQATLCKYKMAHDSEKKISNTLQLQTNDIQQLEWRSFNSVVSTMKQDQRIKTMKMVHNHWPTLEREYKWKRSTTNLCPLC